MSLFGTSPDESSSAQASKSRYSLFDDEPSPAPGSKSSLFADDDSPGVSPWGMTTPKKAGRGELVKNLLPAGEVPDSYIDTFDNLIRGEDGFEGKLTAAGITKVLSSGKIGADEQSRIVSIITSGGQLSDITRNEFNVLLALIGKDSIGFPETDPWASPDMHTGHNHEETPQRNGVSRIVSNGNHQPVRTTSNFTTASADGSNSVSNPPAEDVSTAPTTGIWGSYDGPPRGSYRASNDSTIVGEGFEPSDGGGDHPSSSAPNRSFGGGRVTGGGVEENVTITLLPEKEGMFMFQHHNYKVASLRRGSQVRFCLASRLSTKAVSLPAITITTTEEGRSTFIEKRRRGLARFTNALVRHPVLSQEQLVIMFLTVPTELTVWRKQATISVQEEFSGRHLPPGLEDSLPPTLDGLFERTRSGVRRSAEIYINLCNLMDRLSKRNEGLAADQLRLSLSLQSLMDSSEDTYSTDTNDVPLLNEGLNATAKHLSNSQTLLEDEARAWDQGVLEDLKRQRDALVSMRDMFDRRDRYDKDNIPYLERRIQNNETKLVTIRAKPEGLVKPGEIEKSQYHISRWSQDWAQERVKYSELQANNWKQLHEELESMPLGD
ncbi:PX domain-containing protein [Diplocarpon rosae]|nr:PX domain-containing protein [Diplocarpon rosae]